MRVKIERLEHHADAPANGVDVDAGGEDVDAFHLDRAGGRLLEPAAAAPAAGLKPNHFSCRRATVPSCLRHSSASSTALRSGASSLRKAAPQTKPSSTLSEASLIWSFAFSTA